MLNLDMVKRGVRNPTVWVVSQDDLRPGSTVKGTIDGDPHHSLLFGFPVFALAN